MACSATPDLYVSTEICTSKRFFIASIMGITRSSSSCNESLWLPGFAVSPPISITSAPSAIICSVRNKALSRESKFPPSLKESGVTFKIPITVIFLF